MASFAARVSAWPVSGMMGGGGRCRTRTVAVLAATMPRPTATTTPRRLACHRRRPQTNPAASVVTRGLRSALAASLSPRRGSEEQEEEGADGSGSDDADGRGAAVIVVTGFSPEECAHCRGVLGLPVVAATPAMLSARLSSQAALAAAELDAALERDALAEARASEEQEEEEEEEGEDSGRRGASRDDNGESSSSSFFSSSSAAAGAAANNNDDDDNGESAATSAPSPPPSALALGRTALFVGDRDYAAAHASSFNDALASSELWPAVVAFAPEKHASLPLRDALLAIRDAHARRHRLVQPLRVDSSLARIPDEPGATLVMNLEIDASEAVPVSPAALAAAVAASGGGEGDGTPPPAPTRRDASRVVVLDGLLADDERAELLAALTAPGHDPKLPPPSDKWEARLVDRAGEPPTWGLRAGAIRALLHDPPRTLVALQSRLAALYPEYTICAMPAAAMRGGGGDEYDDDGGGDPSSSVYLGGGEQQGGEDEDDPAFTAPLVANAVAPGDPVAWHVDADPSLLPADAPFSLHYGPYFNREPGLPLFVSVMVYLNEAWSDDWHAETLFVDPGTGVGAFSQAKPGRCVLMDQDVSHRIGAPSAVRAPGLRYSLVLKTVWIPKEGVAGARGICRPEWGPPQQLGSASRAIGPRGREVVAPGASSSGGGGGI